MAPLVASVALATCAGSVALVGLVGAVAPTGPGLLLASADPVVPLATVDGVRLVAAPGLAASTVAFVLAGVLLGVASGLVPGLHVNNLALGLAAVAPAVPGDPLAVGAAMVAAGVVHTFLDVVPALALGIPDPAMAATALPGHRLVLAGRGREALRLSALGSAGAVVLALPLAVPLTAAMRVAYPALRAHLPLVLAAVVGLLLLTESSTRARVAGLVSFALSAGLGGATLDLDPAAPLDAGGVLAPLFAGLFGAPVLLAAMDGAGVPPQADARVTMAPAAVGRTAAAGSLAGAVVGYLPGVSAAVAAVLALPLVGRRGWRVGEAGDGGERSDDDAAGGDAADPSRAFLVAASGANTATAVFALFALAALGAPRTGVAVALEAANVPRALPTLLAATLLAAALGFALVCTVGDAYLRTVGRLNPRRLSLVVLALLAVASYLFAGPAGLGILAAATVVGLVPPRLGARRVYLMGVLIGPLALGP